MDYCKLNLFAARRFVYIRVLAETATFLKMEEYRFTLVRDYDTNPYNWESWENGKVVKSEPAEILAFYKVYLNDDMKTSYGFEIRKDEAGQEIFDHDDTLPDYLYLQGKNIKEVNDLCGRIFDAMYEDYYGEPLQGTFR